MNYGALKAQFIAVLNRRDITPSLTDTFIKQSIQRTQRVLRVPAMEQIATTTLAANGESVTLPADCLQLINVFWQDSAGYWHKLSRRDAGYVYDQRHFVGNAAYYCEIDGKLIIGPQPITTGTIRFEYYADFSVLSSDSDSNWLTDNAPDVVIYGALSFAADYYLDDRRTAFEQRYVSGVDELITQVQLDALSAGAAIAPAYSLNY